MSNLTFAGVDLGGESGRVMLGRFDGSTLQIEEKHRFSTGGTRVGNTLRWDVNRIWDEIKAGLTVVGSEERSIASVGIDTWGVDYALIGKSGQLLGLPYHYRDQRNIGTLSSIESIVPKKEIYRQTGIQFMEINTLCQLFAASKTTELDDADKLLTIPDYFHYLLSGVAANEFTNATTTQCFLPKEKTWATDMLDRLGIRSDLFCDIVNPGTTLSAIKNDVASQTGLSANVVVPATHDTGSAIAAVPTSSPQGTWAYVSSGTWSLVGIELDEPVLTDEAMKANVTNEGGVEGTWRFLKNVMGLWIVQQTRKAFADRNFSRDYTELTQLAANANCDSFIDPDHPSFLDPENMEAALLSFLAKSQQPNVDGEGGLIRCVLESLAIRYAEVLRELESLSGKTIKVIHVVGGGCKNELLNQFIANATGKEVIAGPAEATAIGNMMVQCKTAKGVHSLAEIREVVKNGCELKSFQPADESTWIENAARFGVVCAKVV